MTSKHRVAVIGLGYVGLPLALAFGRVLPTVGIDLSEEKVASYRRGVDPTGEMSAARFREATSLDVTTDAARLEDAEFIVVAVPTPVDQAHQPNLTPVIRATESVGRHMRRGCVVIFESTVYPGVTEEICIPILERESGLICGSDFHVGYSPERVNPGDREHSLEHIVKVVSGQDGPTLDRVAWLYEQVIEAGVHRAPSIKVAEAAKVIENTQRDLNIALMNELAIIFNSLDIDTLEVLRAAGTKWNFLPFRPGLVGGHCIGVDPYYLTYKAEMLGHHPEVILAGRRINDGMGKFIAEQTVKQIVAAGGGIHDAKVLVLGLAFKENCADLRNSHVIDVVRELEAFGIEVIVHDPVVDAADAKAEYGVELCSLDGLVGLAAIVAAVAHDEIVGLDAQKMANMAVPGAPFVDVKSVFDCDALRAAGFRVWRL